MWFEFHQQYDLLWCICQQIRPESLQFWFEVEKVYRINIVCKTPKIDLPFESFHLHQLCAHQRYFRTIRKHEKSARLSLRVIRFPSLLFSLRFRVLCFDTGMSIVLTNVQKSHKIDSQTFKDFWFGWKRNEKLHARKIV